MYCKQCGYRSEEKTAACLKCGAPLSATIQSGATPKPKLRRRVVLGAIIISVITLGVFPRVFFRTELESIGPTDKLRFLRAVQKSEYRRVGQQDIRLEGDTLIVLWDLRWSTLPEHKQEEIVRIVGRAWEIVGGKDTRFRIEGNDDDAALYTKGEVQLGPPPTLP